MANDYPFVVRKRMNKRTEWQRNESEQKEIRKQNPVIAVVVRRSAKSERREKG